MCWPEKNWNQLGSSKAGHNAHSCLQRHAFYPFFLFSKILSCSHIPDCSWGGVCAVLVWECPVCSCVVWRRGKAWGSTGDNELKIVYATSGLCLQSRPLLPFHSEATLPWQPGEIQPGFPLENYFSTVGEMTVNQVPSPILAKVRLATWLKLGLSDALDLEFWCWEKWHNHWKLF